MLLADPGGWIVLALLLVILQHSNAEDNTTTAATADTVATAENATDPGGPSASNPASTTGQKPCYKANNGEYEYPDADDDKDAHNPCFVWEREPGFKERYAYEALIHDVDFWNISVDLTVNVSYMDEWYNKTVVFMAGGLLAPPVCKIDLTKCTDASKPGTAVICKCTSAAQQEEGNTHMKYGLYVNIKAEISHSSREISFMVAERMKDVFPVVYNGGTAPTIWLACRKRCDALKKAANYKCSAIDKAEKDKCDKQGCFCVDYDADIEYIDGKPIWHDPYKNGASCLSTSLHVLTVLMCCWVMCSWV